MRTASPPRTPAAGPAVTPHTLVSRRAVTVYRPDETGQPDRASEAYTLSCVEVAGGRACLRSNEVPGRRFTVSVVHPPARPLPRWARWVGVTRSAPLLVWGGGPLPPRDAGFLSGLDVGLLWKLLLGVLLLWVPAFFHLPKGASAGDVLASRYTLATVAVLGLFLWRQVAGHAHRLRADASEVFHSFRYPLQPLPTGFKAGIASVMLGATRLPVMQGQASDAVHWLHPGPEVDGSHTQPRTCFRFQADGHRFEGCTARQDQKGHPFIVPGDRVRMVVEPGRDGTLRVLALANLTDGHLLLDETDERLATTHGAVVLFGVLLLLVLPVLLGVWLLAGPQADALSAGLLAACIGLAVGWGVARWLRRRRRAALAQALGATLDDMDARGIRVAPLPMTYFG